ncbi:c-type cytochrome [Hymenobacter sp. HMF4947]|uniref:C-type cytochrome n=1 Tax=Hymenobacter ginkgonis TaxID=2682976 RepID=A0A7K1TAS6_9BACT|nr:c-type cytochrome [Hymenobacter ginkgonis]MVN75498.1 c-type cytochrome [Hymenobacter ginkgonis]
MKQIFRILGGLLTLAVVVVVVFALYVQARGIPRYTVPQVAAAAVAPGAPAQLALGEKLVQASCADCHLNQQTGRLSGHQLLDTPKEFGAVYAANITQDPAHGIGAWTDAEIVALLRTGIGRDQRYRLIMPHFVYMSDEDVQAVLAFLHSGHPWVKADPTPSHEQEPSFLLKALANTVMKPTPLVPGPHVAPAPTDTVAYGHYLVVGRYQCYECHSHDFKTNNALHPEQSAGYLGGGNALVDAQGQPVLSRNITGDRATGIGTWTPAQLAAALRVGQSPHGPLRAPMPKYTTMTDAETAALYAYLQSVPKLTNNVPLSSPAVATR